jgi:hypothetical protein
MLESGRCIRPRDVTMSATATTMTVPAMSVRPSMGSCRISAPRITATMGFTYA